jgi:polar amino acid transport system substrate-binding protein
MRLALPRQHPSPSIWFRCLWFAAVALLLAGSPPAEAAEAAESSCPIVIGSCHRPPLSTADAGGILDRLVVEAFRRVGLTACVTSLPCERSLLNANQGVTDGDILRVPAIVEYGYPNLMIVPEPFYRFDFQGFAVRSDLVVRGWEDLKPLRVGFVLGWKILEDRVQAAEVMRARGAEQLFPLLVDRKTDVVIYERLTGLELVRSAGYGGVRLLEPPLLTVDQFLVLNRRHAALAEPLAAAIRSMKADGSYDGAFRAAGRDVPP